MSAGGRSKRNPHRGQAAKRDERAGRRALSRVLDLRFFLCMYEISTALARFESVEKTFPAIVTILARAMPLRSVVFLRRSGGRHRAFVWQAEGESAPGLGRAVARARGSYAYLIGSPAAEPPDLGLPDVPEIPDTAPARAGGRSKRFIALPLVAARGEVFGALQVEATTRFDERDLGFVNAVVNQLAVALQRKKVEEDAALHAQATFERILAMATDAIISVDEDQRITIFNDGAVKIFGYSKKEALGAPLDLLLPARFHAPHRQHVHDFAAGPAAFRRMGERLAIVGRRKTGEEFPAEATISKLAIDGRPGLTVIVHDITERRRLEEVQQAVGTRDERLALVSHDLRVPLSAILLNLAALLDAPDGEVSRRRSRLERIQRSAQRMTGLVQDLLDSASIAASHLAIEPARIAMPPLIAEAIDAALPSAARIGVSLRSELPPGLPEVLADPARVHQVLDNLLSNAIKFTPAGGTITVRGEPAGSAVRMSVTDTGAGIPPSDLPHLFDRFWQARGTDRRGTGLGLFIVKGIVEAHGGEVWVESTVGAGTTFFFTLPLAP